MSSHSDSPISSPSFTEPTGNPSSGPPSLPNDSSGPYEVQEVEKITSILCEKLREVQIQGKRHENRLKKKKRKKKKTKFIRYTIPFDMLPDDVLLEIFESFLLEDHDCDWPCDWHKHIPVSTWHELAHVCQRWRQIVFGSPHRLNIQIDCTNGTSVREFLDCWPPFPIVIRYDQGRHSSLPGDEDGIFAALEHRDRICQIDLRLVGFPAGGLHFDKVVAMMQEPFPSLTHLTLRYEDEEDSDQDSFADRTYERPSILPSGLLGGSAPGLQRIFLQGIPFPALPALLSSTSDLTHLELRDVPEDGYISPEAMVACLGASSPKLKSLSIQYSDSGPSRYDRMFLPPVTRTLFPALTSITLCGTSNYIEDLISRIDGPRVKVLSIDCWKLFDFQFVQFFNFINRSKSPEITSCTHANVDFHSRSVIFKMYLRPDPDDYTCPDVVPVSADIFCPEGTTGMKISHMAQVFNQHSALLSRVVHLHLNLTHSEDHLNDEWLHLFFQFSAVRTLHATWNAAAAVALALEDITGEMVSKVFPVLDLIYFHVNDWRALSFEKFLKARRLSGHPVTVIDTEVEFYKRVASYY